jgi:hypothetical protein
MNSSNKKENCICIKKHTGECAGDLISSLPEIPTMCDGCQRGLAGKDGFHYDENRILIGCTKDRYEGKEEVKTEKVYEGTIPKNFLVPTVEEKTCECPQFSAKKVPPEQKLHYPECSFFPKDHIPDASKTMPTEQEAWVQEFYRLKDTWDNDEEKEIAFIRSLLSSRFQEGYAKGLKEKIILETEMWKEAGKQEERLRVKELVTENLLIKCECTDGGCPNCLRVCALIDQLTSK